MTTTPPQQYCLRWNNYQNNLTNVFDQLLQSEAFVDVTLACDGHSLKAHKMVLSACSPYFQSLFCDNPCSHPIVILKDVKWDELKAIVEFMYRGEINVSQEQLAPLLKVAEVLKIRGLADVSRGTSAEFVSAAAAAAAANGNNNNNNSGNTPGGSSSGNANGPCGPPPSSAASCGGADSDGEITGGNSGNSRLSLHASTAAALSTLQLQHPGLFHHPQHSGSSSANGHHLLASLGRSMRHGHGLPTKRRRISTSDDRSPSPIDNMDDSGSGHLEIDSNAGDYENSREGGITPGPSSSASASVSAAALMSSLGLTPTPANTPTGISNTGGSPNGAGSSGMNHGGLSSSLLTSLHNAAAAAAAAASASNTGSTSSVSNDLDLKPGIVEMIREEERAKMLESSHGWLGPSAASTLSDSYQYQIQSLWQKCWSTNQSGMVHALRFRERGPLKSWRPETMAEAIFSVLREGLSLSQAARKYDIPYPTFVLYANRVHNMLGPSADGCSDMRPKGRGRPQRILLGSWPEDHIRGVIRAVVFRDTAKDDIPFVYNRDPSLCMPPPSQGSSHNGLDMTLHPQFVGSPMNHFLNLQHSGSAAGGCSTSSTPSSAAGANSSTNDSLSCLNPGASVQVELGHSSGSSASSNSNSPLGGASHSHSHGHGHGHSHSHSHSLSRREAAGVQQIQLMAAAAAAAAAQEQREQNLLTSFKSSSSLSDIGRKSRHDDDDDDDRHCDRDGEDRERDHDDDPDGGQLPPLPLPLSCSMQMPEILQIKAEIPFEDELEDDPEDAMNSEDEEFKERVLNSSKSATDVAQSGSASASVVSVVPSSTAGSVITGGIGLAGLGLAGLQVEGHFRQREMNTPSPHFQPS